MSDLPPSQPDQPALSGADRFLLAALHFFSRLSLAFLQGMGWLLGVIAAWFPSGPAWVVRRNLRLCFPDRDERWLRATIRQNLIYTAQTGFEFMKTWGMPPAYSVEQMRELVNMELFHEAIRSPRGCLILVPHYGNWEFMNAWVSQHCQPVIMYKPGKNRSVDQFVREARSRVRATLVPTDERGVKAVFKTLKSGGVSIILPDHTPHDSGGLYAPFFGISVWSGLLSARLIQKTRCAVVMLSCTRLPNAQGFRITADKVDPGVYSEDLATSVAAVNHSVEQLVRRDPSQYQWVYKRFKKCETLRDVYQAQD